MDLRRRVEGAEGVGEIRPVGAEVHFVRAFALGEALQAGAVEVDLVRLAVEPAVAGAGEVNHARLLVDALEGFHVPLAGGDLLLHLAVGGVVVQVLVTRAHAEHHERARAEVGQSERPQMHVVARPVR